MPNWIIWDEMRFRGGWEHWLVGSGKPSKLYIPLLLQLLLWLSKPSHVQKGFFLQSEFPRNHPSPDFKVMSSLLQVILHRVFMRCHLCIFSSPFQVSSLTQRFALLNLDPTHKFPLRVAGWALFTIPSQMNKNEMNFQDMANHPKIGPSLLEIKANQEKNRNL